MLVHYIREKNEVHENENGHYIVSSGPIRGVLVATGRNEVGWSLWNKNAEDDELFEKNVAFWTANGMDPWDAEQKAMKIEAKFDKETGIELALERRKYPGRVPDSIQSLFDAMIDRSHKYYKE